MQTPQIEIKHNIGNEISIPNQFNIKVETFTTVNTNIGATTIPAYNANEFTAGSILLLLSSMGAQNAEILAASGHTGQAFTTAAAVEAHARGESIAQIDYNQVAIYKSATINGVYVLFATQTFQVTQQNTIVLDTAGLSTDYYKVQWKNSISGLLSDFSTPISVLDYPENSVAEIINPVVLAMGISKDDPKINTTFLISAVDDARKLMHAQIYGMRQDWQEKFEQPIQLLAGTNFVNLPDDIDFKKTDRSLLAARFLIANLLTPFNLRYIDKRSWNQAAYQSLGSTTTILANIADVTLTLSNVGDFPASGTAYVATTSPVPAQTIMAIQYTSKDNLTGQLLGVTGITRQIPVGTQIWVQPIISQPIFYTVFDEKIVFDRIVPDSMQGNNLYIDYYKKIDKVVNLYQVLDEHYRENYKWYLRYAIKYRKDTSTSSDDPDITTFKELVKAVFDNMYTGQTSAIITD